MAFGGGLGLGLGIGLNGRRILPGLPPVGDPVVSISGAISQTEGDSGTKTWTYTFTRSITTGTLAINTGFSAGGTDASDWQGGLPGSEVVNFADGVATATRTVTSVGDTGAEGDETFTVSLLAGSGYTVGSPSNANGTILNDDAGGSVPALPAAVTSGATPFIRAQAFQSWVLSCGSTGAAIYPKLADMRAALPVGLSNAGALGAPNSDPRYVSGSKWLRLASVGANVVANIDLVNAQIQCNSTNPTSIAISNTRVVADPTQFFAYAHGPSGPGVSVPETISRVELTGGRTAALDGYGAKTVSGVYVTGTGGDAISVGNSLGPQSYEMMWLQNGAQASYGANTGSHSDAIQDLEGDDVSITNVVAFSVGTTDPGSTFQPAFPAYSTGTFGVNSAIIASPNAGNRRILRRKYLGIAMFWGGFNRVSLSADQAGEVFRNTTLAYCIDCPSEFQLSGGAQSAFYPGMLDAGVVYNPTTGYHQGTFENVLVHEFRNLDGSLVQYNGADSNGIWRYNPNTLDAQTIADWQTLGYLDGSGVPVGGAVKTLAPIVYISNAISQNEGNSGTTAYVYTVTRNATETAATVNWTFDAGTTVAADYVGDVLPTGGALSFAIGEATKTITINVKGETTFEANEAFTVSITVPNGFGPGAALSATGTILNDDTGTLPYTMLHDFESGSPASTTASISFDTSSRKTQGAQGLKILGNTSNAITSVSAVKTGITTDMANFERVMVCFDFGDLGYNPAQLARLDFYIGASQYIMPGGTPNEFTTLGPFPRGKHWMSFPLAEMKLSGTGASIQAQGTASKEIRLRFTDSTTFSRAIDVVADAAILQAPDVHTPSVVITCDDVIDSQYDNLFPLMQSRGLKGTIMECSGLVGTATRLLQSEIDEMRAAGWRVCLDSGLGSDSLTSYGTLANAITQLKANRTALIAKYGDTAAANSICYANGAMGIRAVGPSNANMTIAGSISGSTITVTGANDCAKVVGWVCRGLRAFNAAGTLLGTITGVTFGGSTCTLTLDNAPGDAASANISYCGFIPKLTVNANGTNSVTVTGTDANKVFVGMHLVTYTNDSTPRKVTAVTVNSATSATLTLDGTVPTTTTALADMAYIDGEWWPTKVHDALLAEGFNFGRYGAQGGGVNSAYGLDARTLMWMPALPLDNSTSTHLATIRSLVQRGFDVILYIHSVTSGSVATYWQGIIDGLADDQATGLHVVQTLPDYVATVQGRAPFA